MERPIRPLASGVGPKEDAYGKEDHLLYKKDKIFWRKRMWKSRVKKKKRKIASWSGAFGRSNGAVDDAVILAIMRALVKLM